MTKYLLGPLKEDFRIVTVTSMTDDGMSTGQLRNDLGVLPPGDLIKHMAALAEAPEWKVKLWRTRFGREEFESGHRGHTFGNLFLAGIEYATGDFEKAFREAEAFLEIKNNRAYPATIDNVHLCAELENGEIITGEDEIDVPKKHDPALKIKKIFLQPEGKVYEPLVSEISNADLLVFGPSDFYSSLIPCFLPKGMKKAIKESRAKKIYVANTMTKYGETRGFTLQEFTGEVENYIGCCLDFVICQKPEISRVQADNWRKTHPEIHEPVTVAPELDKKKFISADIMINGVYSYDPKKIKKIITKIIKHE